MGGNFENISSNLSGESIKINLSNNEIGFIKPSLIERFYISISNPIFTYLFFVLGFALIGLELFALGPGLMAFIGGSLVIFSTMAFEEFGINYFGIILFIISFLIYIKILSRGYFSLLGIGAFLLLYLSSLVMFRDYEMSKLYFEMLPDILPNQESHYLGCEIAYEIDITKPITP